VADPDRRRIKVAWPDGIVAFRSGQEIPLMLFGGVTVSLDTVFAWKIRYQYHDRPRNRIA
jgi:hypothetical protein